MATGQRRKIKRLTSTAARANARFEDGESRQFSGHVFTSAEQAWFWRCAAQQASDDGARPRPGHGEGHVCTPQDIDIVLRRMMDAGRIQPWDVQVIVRWGRQHLTPCHNSSRRSERADADRWDRCMAAMQVELRSKGIVG